MTTATLDGIFDTDRRYTQGRLLVKANSQEEALKYVKAIADQLKGEDNYLMDEYRSADIFPLETRPNGYVIGFIVGSSIYENFLIEATF